MKKIVEYRKLLNVEKTVQLKELKTIYRNAMKSAHPDKFPGDADGQHKAEAQSKEIIEAYHFLVSINPETINSGLSEFKETTSNTPITDFKYEDVRLKITFADGNIYEFISVPKTTYVKMVNADSPARFAKRHIYPAFAYRKVSTSEVMA